MPFAVYADENVYGPVLVGLRRRGWDVLRAVDVRPGERDDEAHLIEAATRGRVLVTNDADLLGIARRWMTQGRSFPGLVYWSQDKYGTSNVGDVIEKLEAIDPAGLANGVRYL